MAGSYSAEPTTSCLRSARVSIHAWYHTRRLPGPRTGRFSLIRKSAQRPCPRRRSRSCRLGATRATRSRAGTRRRRSNRRWLFAVEKADPARFIVEELMPYSRPEQTAANLPLALDDPEAVWWVSSGSVDVFFIQFEPGVTAGRRRHLCRVEEGGSIFSISGVRGRAGGGLLAVGAGGATPQVRPGRLDPAQLRGRAFRASGRFD